ncbi:hypothetical protein [Aquibium microcysteis]|uniref:hypothetical protein n=1 Tax=Aquibium microcysteis TaxID=675281 RepID=UPI00165D0D2A|nr:hypothetical protein [Aquibium microcysteis]
MESQFYSLGFVVYEIDPHTHDDIGIVAFGRNALVAQAAFTAALERMPRSMLMIRHRARIIHTGVGEALRRDGDYRPA